LIRGGSVRKWRRVGVRPAKIKKVEQPMFQIMRFFLILLLGMALASCSTKVPTFNGLAVTQVQVDKSDRKLYLLNNEKVLKSYTMALGFSPIGHKEIEGDGRTPEGLYYISDRNPNSNYHLSLRISYPNEQDIAKAKALGQPPGGDIFIHGGPRGPITQSDWTAGCISVTDRQMEEIYSMVNLGTPIWIIE
jgi:murein L,D-transpeptidase YafK